MADQGAEGGSFSRPTTPTRRCESLCWSSRRYYTNIARAKPPTGIAPVIIDPGWW